MSVRVVIADPNGLVRDLLRVVLVSRDITVVGDTSSWADLLALCQEHIPDVAVCTGTLTDGPVEQFLADVLAAGPGVLVLSDDASPERITDLMSAGADGYLLHDSAPDTVADAVIAVAQGIAALHPSVANVILRQWRRLRTDPDRVTGGGALPGQLTNREMDVLLSLADGLSTKGVARSLGMATKTVENHKIHIFDKLGVRTQAHAVAVAISHGLLGSPKTEALAVAE